MDRPPYVIRILARADGTPVKGLEGGMNLFVKAYSLTDATGRGAVAVTHEPDKALRFDTKTACFTAWSATHQRVPVRPDGKPNKPLTSYHCEFLPLEDARVVEPLPDTGTEWPAGAVLVPGPCPRCGAKRSVGTLRLKLGRRAPQTHRACVECVTDIAVGAEHVGASLELQTASGFIGVRADPLRPL